MPLGPLIEGELHLAHRFDAPRNAFAASVGLHPNAPHVGFDLAIAVGAHTAARAVAQGLGAIHRTGHAGRTQHALTAHAAIEQQTLDGLLDHRNRPLDAFIAYRVE